MSAAISARGLRVRVGGHVLLDAVDLDVVAGSWTALVGVNGAGKSTLVRCLVGLVRHEGTVALCGQDAAGLPRRHRARLVAHVPQTPVAPPGMRVIDYVLLGRSAHQGLRLSPSAHDVRVALAVLQRLDLDGLVDRHLTTLSGGERQRATIARALAQEAPVLVLDEPTSSLDLGHAAEVLDLLDDLRAERGLTLVTALHDLTVAAGYADHLVLLERGRVAAQGTPRGVLAPEVIARHFGVAAELDHHDDGSITWRVRRRRERVAAPTETVTGQDATR
jgi:iron complex transport system ATP-binding protein